MKRIQEDLSFISGISFRFVTLLRKEYPIAKATANKITSQPGYKVGEEMCIGKLGEGKYRLFVRVGNQWMDASLEDIE